MHGPSHTVSTEVGIDAVSRGPGHLTNGRGDITQAIPGLCAGDTGDQSFLAGVNQALVCCTALASDDHAQR